MVKPKERLGNYEVMADAEGAALILGSGAGGVTYRGRHIHLATEVAIKVLVRRKNLFQKDRDAFLSEARSAASLTHPQIARILDFGESAQQHPYYVMELCEGGSLEEFGQKSGPPDEYSCIQWFFESAAALAHAHQKGILHRDIKPSNLLVAKENEIASVKLIDFGLADHARQDESQDHVIGTPHFAAPEQLRGQAVPASDVFSLGATFLWLLTNKHLSEGDVKNVISQRLEATSYASSLASLPAGWQALLGRMLEVDPSRRPPDGGEVLAAAQVHFPNHPGHPVVWDAAADFPGTGGYATIPTAWQDHPGIAWQALWTEQGAPVAIDHGTSVKAVRPGDGSIYDVSRYTCLTPEIVTVLETQADLVAHHSAGLGLEQVILQRGDDWWSIAWLALGNDDALSWVRQGQTASTAEILAALEAIAAALDGVLSAGFEHLEIHPSMLIVSGQAPLKFSLAVPLPAFAEGHETADSAGTMRGAMGAGLAARFASCIYQLLSGRTPPPAAFVNARAYQAIPKLTERSNRFLASAISGTLASGTCRDVIRGLAHEERIPGASLSGGGSLGSRTSASWRSSPSISMPAPASAVVVSAPLEPAPEVRPIPPPPPQPVTPAVSNNKGRMAAIAAAVVLTLGGGAWHFFPKPSQTTTPKPVASTSTAPPKILPIPEPPAAIPPPVAPKSTVTVPGDAATLAEAIALCQSGGTVEISSGTYAEALVITKSISLISKSAAVIEDAGLESSLVTVRGPVEVTLRNIQIRSTQTQAKNAVESSPSLVVITDSAVVTLEGCVIERSTGSGVSISDKASAIFSNCRIRNNRAYGITADSGAKADITLSELQQNGLAGIAAMNVETRITLKNGANVSSNSRNGVEIGNGATCQGSGAQISENRKVGLQLDGAGSTARLDSSCVISANHQFGIGIINSATLEMTGCTVDTSKENGIYLEAGGQATIRDSEFSSNGKVGIYLVNGAQSRLAVSGTKFTSHVEAGVAIVEGRGELTTCHFSGNPMAIFFGKGATGKATGNTIFPGPVDQALVLEQAGEVILENNSVGSAGQR